MRNVKMKIIVLLAVLISLTIFAEDKKEDMLSLQSMANGKYYKLKIDKMKINVNIIANIAETTLDITFKNDLDTIIEGTLYIPLKENASIFEYQFEMNHKMKKGVIVEKEKARIAYEETVRKQVDPGLLIWTKGNNFKTRIYPINAKSTKRIIVSYQEELSPNFNKDCGGKCPAYYYSLPLSIDYKLSMFSVNINGNGNNIIPVTKAKNRFISDKNGKLTLIDENYTPNENIKLAVFNKNVSNKKSIVNMSYDKNKKNWYFTATVFPNQFNTVSSTAQVIKKKKPKRICLYWDTSTSMSTRNLEKEINFITNYAKYLGNSNISLINFSNDKTIVGKFVSKKGKLPKRIIEKLKNTIYDGGTQLGAINTKKTPNSCQEALIFTDGVSNFGKNQPNLTIPTYFINSKLTAEHSYMKDLSNKSGASYINLQNTSLEKALKIINSQQKLRFLSIGKDARPCISTRNSKTKCNISETWPNTPVEVRDSFTIVGILNASTPLSDRKILLNFGFGNKIKQTIEVPLSIARTDRHGGLSVQSIERQFARHKIKALLKNKAKNESEIVYTSKKFSILTEFTSFLVLETLEDYLKYKIIPPKDMQEEYFEVLENKKVEKEKSLKSHIEIVLNKYNELKKYWSKKHKTEFQIKEEKRKAEIARKKAEIARKKAEEKRKREEKNRRKEGRKTAKKSNSSNKMMMVGSSGSGGGGSSNGEIVQESSGSAYGGVVSFNKNKSTKVGASRLSASIELKAFDPDTPYLKELVKIKKGHYKLYLKLRKNYTKSSSFYLDVSDFFMKKNKKKLALKILSNIVELELENHELLRILGYRLWQLKKYKLAVYVFGEVLKMRPEEPQSHRDLGLTYRSMKKYQKAVNYLYKVATNDWDSRFSDIDLIALYEMNAIIGRVGKKRFDLSNFDKRLIQNLPVDVRVVLSWDANNTDIDLWVTDPYGEKCFYSHKKTVIGGWNSNDFTGGYGPEMFILRKAHKGKYKIQANYYGTSSHNLSGEVTLHIELFLNYGKKNQTRKEIVLRVKNQEEVVDIGDFKVK